MDFLPEDIQEYVSQHSEAESELLQRISRETRVEVLMPRMLSGHIQGRVLAMLSKLVRPKFILEIGTYTGYSALCLAEGLVTEGKLITIDVNEELESRVRSYFAESAFNEKIDFHIGDANDIIPTLDLRFDMAFIDADKVNYSNYYDLILDKMNPGALIVADNVLWSGKVIEARRKKLDEDTDALLKFNKKVQEDPRVENLLLPVRDGLMLIRKIE